jgi:serine incorporator 1/3
VGKPLNKELLEGEEANLSLYGGWEWPKWHFYMCLASIYVGMLVTNWTSASITTDTLISNDFGFWVRVVISWATALLFLWTLVAPRVCSERDFTVV